jgi:1,4-alpha-glucan branching enzyme
VEILDAQTGEVVKSLECCHPDGFFAVSTGKKRGRFAYKLKVSYAAHDVVMDDPYRFSSLLDETDRYLFCEGTNEQAYDWLGSHIREHEGVEGTLFVVWAPSAQRVSVVGDFNAWDGRRHVMRKHLGSGLWEIFLPDVGAGAHYKFEIRGPQGELLPLKADPYAFAMQGAPETASLVLQQDTYTWQDSAWMEQRKTRQQRDKAISIYEVHLGSWRRKAEEGDRYLSYRELADELIPYVKEMGFTHIETMPITEFPFDGSWGYQPVGMFAPTSRFGPPDDCRYFIDRCHQEGIGVIMDWVPGHFPYDEHGLGRFDGTALYEHDDPRQGFHPDWNTFIYNYGRKEVLNYLVTNALFWLDKYHIDGLRVDAVASMLYLDYSREEGEWIPNVHGGRENLEAVEFLKDFNIRSYGKYEGIMTLAEESTSWPGVSQPTESGGLGFGFKWNMGWMNDTLSYMSNDPIHRRYHHNEMTFGMVYAFSENFVLPISHDEVVHGKGSILSRMPGDNWQQFANLRAYYGFMWGHPGKKLLFQGCEFGQRKEWNHDASLDWHLLGDPMHAGVKSLVKDLNHLYCNTPELYQLDCDGAGFEWIVSDADQDSLFAFIRKGDGNTPVMVVVNMTPVPHEAYRLGVPALGYYSEKLNTDSAIYGGSDVGNAGGVWAEAVPSHGRENSVCLRLPPLAAVILQLEAG